MSIASHTDQPPSTQPIRHSGAADQGRPTGADTVRLWTRRLGALVLGLAAVWVFVAMEPEPAPSTAAIADALHKAEVNEAAAISAPQQDVVNGWVARDLLAIIAGQADRPTDQRPAAMLMLGVLGLCLGLVTSPGGSRSMSRGSGVVAAEPAARPGEIPPQGHSTAPATAAGLSWPGALRHPDAWIRPGTDRPTPEPPTPSPPPQSPNPWIGGQDGTQR